MLKASGAMPVPPRSRLGSRALQRDFSQLGVRISSEIEAAHS